MSEDRTDTLPYRSVALGALIALSIAGLAVATAVFRSFVVLIIIGLVFSEVFQAIADPLARRIGGPRGFWIVLAVLIVVAAVAGFLALALYPLAEQLGGLASEAPEIFQRIARRGERLSRWVGDGRVPREATSSTDLAQVIGRRLDEIILGGGSLALGLLDGVFQALAVFFLGTVVAMTPRRTQSAFLARFPEAARPRLEGFVRATRSRLRGWMISVTIAMGIVGTLVTTGLWLMGVPYFLVWGVVAGAMELVPYLGPILAFMGPAALCLATDPGKLAEVGIFYAVVYGLEANVVVPLILRSRAHTSAPLVVLSILVLGRLAGVLGTVAAMPVLMISLAAVEELWLKPRDEPGAILPPVA